MFMVSNDFRDKAHDIEVYILIKTYFVIRISS